MQNGSKNGVYFWGYETISKIKKNDKSVPQNPTASLSTAECPDGYLPNGQGMCCNPFTGICISEGGENISGIPSDEHSITETKTETRTRTITTQGNSGISGGCPNGYLSNGQGKCCNSFSDGCVDELPATQGTANICVIEHCIDVYERVCFMGSCSSWTYMYSNCSNTTFQCGEEGGGGIGGDGIGGDGESSGGSNLGDSPKGFSTLTTRFNRPDRRSEVINSPCVGYRRMWEYSFRNNDPVLTKEMGGLLTSSGKVIILPSYDNGATSVSFKPEYFDESGRIIVAIYLQQGIIKVDVISYEGNSQVGTTITYNVEATIHSHPYTNGTLHDIYNASPNDLKLAENYPEIKHYLLTQDKLVEYNSTNSQINANSHNCP